MASNQPNFNVKPVGQPPTVTIWVAARDEAERLPLLLTSLIAQDYPVGQLKILIGNDQSTDATGDIISKASGLYPYIELIDVPDYPTQLRSKSRVLNYLAQQTDSDYVLITDADIVLPSHWISSMIAYLTSTINGKSVQMVSGITTMLGKSVYARLQGLDWLTALYTVSLLDKVNVGVTALGNNMGFDFKAYQAIGGYAALPPSIVEDFQLYMAFRSAGYQTANIYHDQLLATTFAPDTWAAYLKQRSRWLSGGLQSDPVVTSIFFAQFGWYPTLALLAIMGTGLISSLAISLILMRYVFTVGLCYTAILKADNPQNGLLPKLVWLPWVFDFYFIIGYLATIWVYYTQPSIDWKGRTYPSGR